MKYRCNRCHALIQMEHTGDVFDGETFEEVWSRDCPFCGKSNYIFKEVK